MDGHKTTNDRDGFSSIKTYISHLWTEYYEHLKAYKHEGGETYNNLRKIYPKSQMTLFWIST